MFMIMTQSQYITNSRNLEKVYLNKSFNPFFFARLNTNNEIMEEQSICQLTLPTILFVQNRLIE